MDEETQKAFDAGRPSAVPSFLLFLFSAVTLVFGVAYFTRELLGSGQPPTTFNDLLCVLSFFVAGTCLTVSIFCQWRRYHNAPDRKFFRQHPASALEQWTQIAGYVLLCAAFLVASRLTSAENKPARANF